MGNLVNSACSYSPHSDPNIPLLIQWLPPPPSFSSASSSLLCGHLFLLSIQPRPPSWPSSFSSPYLLRGHPSPLPPHPSSDSATSSSSSLIPPHVQHIIILYPIAAISRSSFRFPSLSSINFMVAEWWGGRGGEGRGGHRGEMRRQRAAVASM